jgi:type I restriction enzyme S subunit
VAAGKATAMDAPEVVERVLGQGSFSVEKFVESFPILVEAAGGTTRLREMVRDLAVCGGLDTQVASDGQASALLDGADQESAEIAAPVTLPPSWVWTPFSNAAEIASNLVDPAQFKEMPHVAPDNIEKGTGRLLPYRTIAEDGVTSSKHRFYAGQVLYSKIRPNLNKVVIVTFDGLCSADMYPLKPHFDARYLQLFMLSGLFLSQVVRSDNRLAMPKVNQEQLRATIVALPPLAEQKRIVARVDQLMALIDQLEAKQNRKREIGARFTKASLEAITTAESLQEFTAAWTRVQSAWPTLLDHPDKVSEVRRAILKMGIQGRLVRQISSDEPAARFLSRIGVQPGSPNPKIAGGESPQGWERAQIGEVAVVKSGTTLAPELECASGDWPYLKIADMNLPGNEKEAVLSSRYVRKSEDLRHYLIAPGSIIFPKRGGAIATNKKRMVRRPILVDLNTMAITCPPEMYFEYVYLWFLTIDLAELDNGTSVPQINHKDISPLVLPVPPLAEQKRIVAKVEQLMNLCDALEAALRRSEDRAAKLVEAVVQEMVA